MTGREAVCPQWEATAGCSQVETRPDQCFSPDVMVTFKGCN